MATFDERDDAVRDEEEVRSSPGQRNRPLLMAGLGLALMLVGYAAMTYVPATPRPVEQTRRLDEFRRMAAQDPSEGGNAALAKRLDQVAARGGNPPYQMAGRLAIYGGLFLFVMAGVIMYRSPAPTKEIDERE